MVVVQQSGVSYSNDALSLHPLGASMRSVWSVRLKLAMHTESSQSIQ